MRSEPSTRMGEVEYDSSVPLVVQASRDELYSCLLISRMDLH